MDVLCMLSFYMYVNSKYDTSYNRKVKEELIKGLLVKHPNVSEGILKS